MMKKKNGLGTSYREVETVLVSIDVFLIFLVNLDIHLSFVPLYNAELDSHSLTAAVVLKNELYVSFLRVYLSSFCLVTYHSFIF